MKPVAAILTLIWGMLMIEPAFANINCKPASSYCAKNKPAPSSCSKTKCNKAAKQQKKENKNDCENNRCNPLMSCPTGNFYFFAPAVLSMFTITQVKQKLILVNDNRILKQLTECWHPPEII